MRTFCRVVVPLSLVAFGYVLGSLNGLSTGTLSAQNTGVELSQESHDKLKAARDAVESSTLALQNDKAYVPAIEGVNSFAATTGGIDAIQDLQTGRGVDPETFAGLYAGLAVNEVASKLTRDSEGRLLYEDKLVRLYPISRMKQLFQMRANAPEEKPVGKAVGGDESN